MNKEELIDWFCDKYNSCYPVIHPDCPQSIFMFYDKQFVRNFKLCKLSGASIKLPSKVTGICLFEQNMHYKLFYYNYNEIHQFLYKNYNNSSTEINKFIKNILNDTNKLQVLIPYCNPAVDNLFLDNTNKLQLLTPHIISSNMEGLNDDNKLQLLTPAPISGPISSPLNDTNKLQVLTTFKRCRSFIPPSQ